ncbi:ABC transporter substrate-binding protein [Eubacterium sp.]|uniref:ABC transporter substrate-binding protein n=1 Tax=Eubacterium sp. TaxID=142586 RepID=UPI00351F95CD
MRKKFLSTVLALTMVVTMAVGCGKSADTNSSAKKGDDKVTLKVFTNLPDRKNGQGLVEQQIIDEYMKENKNVTIKVEALDEEAYKTKFKAYSMEGMPDVVSIWGQPSFLDEVLDAGVLAELNEDDYKDYGFISGSLDGFKKDGKLYGLPRNTDVAGFYYNEKMFKENGWTVPKTYDELLELAKKINDKGIIPLAMDGEMDGQWLFTFQTFFTN